MQKRWLLVLMLLVLGSMLLATGCDDDSDETDGDTTMDGDTNTGDGDVVLPDGDVNTDCFGLCMAKDGYVCDVDTQTCVRPSCTPCDPENALFYCGEGGECKEFTVTFSDEEYNYTASFCTKDCTGDSDCDQGFACTEGKCAPTFVCEVTLPPSAPGGPCEFGPVWPGRTCALGGSCVGNDTTSLSCTDNDDCAGSMDNGYCNNGICGFSLCVLPCNFDGSCPQIDGLPEMNSDIISGSCYCGSCPSFTPKGDGQLGDVCNPNCTDPIDTYCAEGNYCLGLTYNGSCTTDADCSEANGFDPGAYCNSDNGCALSICTYVANSPEECPAGSNPFFSQDGTYYCSTPPYADASGSATIGEACTPGTETEKWGTADYCKPGLLCIENNSMSVACTTTADCSEAVFGPNRYCNEGSCTATVCGQRCSQEFDENGRPLTAPYCATDGTLKVGFAPIGYCYCTYPPYGEPETIADCTGTCDSSVTFPICFGDKICACEGGNYTAKDCVYECAQQGKNYVECDRDSFGFNTCICEEPVVPTDGDEPADGDKPADGDNVIIWP